MKFDFHPEAEKEFLAAISYYEECEPRLGEDFSLEILHDTKYSILPIYMAGPGR
jgi:hypothetical protein